MIRISDLTPEHVGRRVVYIPFPGARVMADKGVITSWNSHFIFVRYDGMGETPAATSPADLEWE